MDRQTLRRRRLLIGCAGLTLSMVLIGFGFFALGVIIMAVSLVYLARRQGVPVIVYHSVSSDASWLPWARNTSVRPYVFTRHMTVLDQSGWAVISDKDLFSALAGQKSLPRRSVVLHFDDAYADNLSNAVPVLEKHRFPACIFASSDFIDQSTGLRRTLGPCARGYLNADELRHIDTNPLFEIASHGKDHARIAINDSTTTRPSVTKWGVETAFLWSLMTGDKSRWFETSPPDIAVVPANDSSLTGLIPLETLTDQEARVTTNLSEARSGLSAILGRPVTYLCWPFDRVTPAARTSALAAGFDRFTGGRADNRQGENSCDVSRTHINDMAAGPAPLWVEGIVFRAKIEVASGNLLWLPITVAASIRRKKHAPFLHGHSA